MIIMIITFTLPVVVVEDLRLLGRAGAAAQRLSAGLAHPLVAAHGVLLADVAVVVVDAVLLARDRRDERQDRDQRRDPHGVAWWHKNYQYLKLNGI